MPELSQFNLSNIQAFVLMFPTLPPETIGESKRKTLSRNNPFHFHITTALLPGLGFDVTDTSHIQKHREIVGRISYEPFTTTFLVDEQFENYIILFKWLQFVHDNYLHFGHCKKEHLVDVALETINNFGIRTSLFNFINLYPSALGQVQFDYTQSEVLTCDITFEYDYIVLEEN